MIEVKTKKELERELNFAKGTLGEYVYSNYLEWRSEGQIVCQSLGKAGQDRGIDWRIFSGSHPIDIDVKLNVESLDSFTLYYHNGTALRMPFYPTCAATWIGVVSFQWEAFAGKGSVEQTLEKVNQAIETLKQECITKSFTYTTELLSKYVVSIVDVKTSLVTYLCRNFDSFRVGEGNYLGDPNKPKLASRKEVWNGSTVARIYWHSIEDNYKIVHYKNEDINIEHIASSNIALTTTWKYSKSEKITIDAKGKLLTEMNKGELGWIRNENKKKSSGFKNNFGVSQEEFDRILGELIEEKLLLEVKA